MMTEGKYPQVVLEKAARAFEQVGKEIRQWQPHIQLMAWGIFILGYTLIGWAMLTNRFFSSLVGYCTLKMDIFMTSTRDDKSIKVSC
jgi:hypothetical protein